MLAVASPETIVAHLRPAMNTSYFHVGKNRLVTEKPLYEKLEMICMNEIGVNLPCAGRSTPVVLFRGQFVIICVLSECIYKYKYLLNHDK